MVSKGLNSAANPIQLSQAARLLLLADARSRGPANYPQATHKHLWINCGRILLLVTCNDAQSSNGAVFSGVLLATMKPQQAVAIRFVGRRVKASTCLFFVQRTGNSPSPHTEIVCLRAASC